MQRMRGRARFTIVAVAVAMVVGACTSEGTSEGRTGDKAGGTGEPVVLKMATTNGDLDFTPQIKYLVERVAQLSDGNVRIDPVYEVGDFAPDAEQQVVRGVAAGEFDLGYVGTQGFEALGAENFVALTAPMLIDSYALEDAVIKSGVTDQMLQGLEDVGVTGLGVLAGALRKPVTVKRPVLGPSDWQGITFGTFDSEGQAEAIRALDATPMKVVGDERDRALEEGSIDGFESSLLSYRLNGQERSAPYVAANVNLWPLTLAVVGNPDAVTELSEQQRAWLHQAMDDAAQRSTTLVDTDERSLEESCDLGARFALASDADLAGLQEAFAPVYASLQEDPATQGFIEQIQQLKLSTPFEPAPAFGAECMGEAPGQAGTAAGSADAKAASSLNGVYRFSISKEEATAAGAGDDPDYPTTQTVWLEDGDWTMEGPEGSNGGTYVVNGDEISFETPSYDVINTFTFTRDEEGNLTLEAVEPMDPGDRILMTTKTWTKID
ncbi:MAG TPA: TRAP transporter substrate-binding protein DctP [Actinomycetota bacterium]|nr:TRAP transporter substrate-binding protein DctP [Actinomycetota bacterium]